MSLSREEEIKAREFSKYCGNADKEFIKSLLSEKTSNINGFNLSGTLPGVDETVYFRPLCSAVFHKNYEVAKLLLELGAKIWIIKNYYCQASNDKLQPFFLAIKQNDVEMLNILLNFTPTKKHYKVILEAAAEYDNLEILKMLFPKFDTSAYRYLPYHAVKQRAYSVLDYLFDTLAKDNDTFQKHRSNFAFAFTEACYKSDAYMIRYFIRKVDENKLNYDDDFFGYGLFRAIANDVDYDTIMMIFAKCNPNHTDSEIGGDYIDCAVEFKRFDVLRTLVEHVDLNVLNKNGKAFGNIFDMLCLDPDSDREFSAKYEQEVAEKLAVDENMGYGDPNFVESFKIIYEHQKASGYPCDYKFIRGFPALNEVMGV